jgi:GTP:adenosylcobinamide-phosphate guanylyltransferase
MLAIIFAGGKGSRSTLGVEKPLLEVGNIKIIDRIIRAIDASALTEFKVAVSYHTPQTKAYCLSNCYPIIETSGNDYHEDIGELLRTYPRFISIVGDMPFITPTAINRLISSCTGNRNVQSVTGVVDVDILPAGIIPSYTFMYNNKEVAVIGLNIVTNAPSSTVIMFEEPLLALNINTLADLEFANKLVTQ